MQLNTFLQAKVSLQTKLPLLKQMALTKINYWNLRYLSYNNCWQNLCKSLPSNWKSNFQPDYRDTLRKIISIFKNCPYILKISKHLLVFSNFNVKHLGNLSLQLKLECKGQMEYLFNLLNCLLIYDIIDQYVTNIITNDISSSVLSVRERKPVITPIYKERIDNARITIIRRVSYMVSQNYFPGIGLCLSIY